MPGSQNSVSNVVSDAPPPYSACAEYQNIPSGEKLEQQSWYRERSRFVEEMDARMVTDPMATHPQAISQIPDIQRIHQETVEPVNQCERTTRAELASRKPPRRVEIVLRHVKATKYQPTGFIAWETLKQRNGPYVSLEKYGKTYDELRQSVTQLAIDMYPKLDVQGAMDRSKAGFKDACRNRMLTRIHGDELPISRGRWDEDRVDVGLVEGAKVIFEFEAMKKPKNPECHGPVCKIFTKLAEKLFSAANPATDEFTRALDKRLRKVQTLEEKREEKEQEKEQKKAEKRKEKENVAEDAEEKKPLLSRCPKKTPFQDRRKLEEKDSGAPFHRAIAAAHRQQEGKREWVGMLADTSYLLPFC